jgi:predicted transcriptional regulator
VCAAAALRGRRGLTQTRYASRPVSTAVPPPLHELESEVMEEVWARGEATVRDVQESLNARAEKIRAYTTLLTVMTRLGSKGLLVRRRAGRLDIYTPALSRDAYLEARAEAEVSAIVEDFGDLALAHFARHMERLDPERLERLRRLAAGG